MSKENISVAEFKSDKKKITKVELTEKLKRKMKEQQMKRSNKHQQNRIINGYCKKNGY